MKSFEAQTYRAVIHRKVLPPAEGFHLEILSEVIFSSPLLSSISSLNCTLLLTETLPSGLYVDAFQLRNFNQLGGPFVTSRRPIDTEAPAFDSTNEQLRVYHHFRLDKGRQRLVSQLVLPIHLRYHRAVTNGDPTHTVFSHPLTDISCWDDGSSIQSMSEQNNAWLPFDAEAATPTLKISIPRADVNHAPYVVVATFCACLWAMAQLWTAKSVEAKQND